MLRGLMEKRRRKPAEPMLIGDHTLDFTAEDFTRPPLIVVPPEIVHLAAHLDGFSPERGTVLAESETPNGFPICFRRWYSRDGWEAFKDTCLDALLNRYEGIPFEHSLIFREWERPDNGFMEALAPC